MTGAIEYLPVSGSCPRCACALGLGSSERDGRWFCCGRCAGGSTCVCGCQRGSGVARPSDLYVPARRMFAARHPDYLNTPKDFVQKRRAFPFSERASKPGPARRKPRD